MKKIALCTTLALMLAMTLPAEAKEAGTALADSKLTVKTEYVENRVFSAPKRRTGKHVDSLEKDSEKKKDPPVNKKDKKTNGNASSDGSDAFELKREWQTDQDYVLEDPAPLNLKDLKEAVDVKDPRSVAAYWVWSVNCLTKNYDDGMEMMKYLFADIEPFGRGYTEGGVSGKAGWDTYFNERLKDKQYSWLPQAYFEGGSRSNNFEPETPLTIELYYNSNNTETINDQTLSSLGRLNIVYWVKSHAGGNQVNITLSRFEGTDRWYVTSGSSSTALFYQQ